MTSLNCRRIWITIGPTKAIATASAPFCSRRPRPKALAKSRSHEVRSPRVCHGPTHMSSRGTSFMVRPM